MVYLLDHIYGGSPLFSQGDNHPLRATQPVALNDVMEGNLSTYQADLDMDRDRWYEMLGERLREIFGADSLSPEELERRKRRYGDPRVSTIVRDYLSRFVGVVSFSADPLIPTMWAHYAENSGFVVGYRTDAIRLLGVGLRRVLYMELAPIYWPERDDTVEINFVDEKRRKAGPRKQGNTDSWQPRLPEARERLENPVRLAVREGRRLEERTGDKAAGRPGDVEADGQDRPEPT